MQDCPLVHKFWHQTPIRYFLFDNRVISLDETSSFVEQSLVSFDQHRYGLWLVFTRGMDPLAGFAGFFQSETGTPSLIYGIHPDLWGQNYATEAARAVLSYALETLGLPKVRADVDEPNVASIRVLEKLGMQQIGPAIVNGHPLLYFERSRLKSLSLEDTSGKPSA